MSDYVARLTRAVEPMVGIWAGQVAGYWEALNAVLAALCDEVRRAAEKEHRIIVEVPFTLAEEHIHSISASVRGRADSAVGDYCLRHILDFLRDRELLYAPLPRIAHRTRRLCVVNLASPAMVAWPYLDRLVMTWWDRSLTIRPAPSRAGKPDERPANLAAIQNEYVCSAIFALVLDGAGIRDHRGLPVGQLRWGDFDRNLEFVRLPLNRPKSARRPAVRTAGASRSARTTLRLSWWTQLVLNRYRLFLQRYGPTLGHGLDNPCVFPEIYRYRMVHFKTWLQSLNLQDPGGTPPAYRTDRPFEPPRGGSPITPYTLVHATRADLVATVPPCLIAPWTGLVRHRPLTEASRARLASGAPSSAAPPLPALSAGHAPLTALPFVDDLPPSNAEGPEDEDDRLTTWPTPLQRIMHAIWTHVRCVGKGSTPEDLRRTAQAVEPYVQSLPLLPPDWAEESDAALTSNLRLTGEFLVHLLRTRRVSENDVPLAPGTIFNYYRNMAEHILRGVGTTNLLSITNAEQLTEVIANSLSHYRNPRTQEWLRTKWKAFLAFLRERHNFVVVDDLDWRDDRVIVAGEDAPYSLITYLDLDEACTLVLSTREGYQAELLVQAYLLAGFAGLRLVEMCHLTLGDFFMSQGLLFLRIPVSKTRAGLRTVPLSLLLHPADLQRVMAWWRQRAALSDDPAFRRHLPFLGQGPGCEPVDAKALREAAAYYLKKVAADAERASLHGLRHTFASLLLLRWYHLRFSMTIGPPVFDVSHRIFEDRCSANLHQALTGRSADEGVPDDGYHDPILQLIARLLGHADLEQTVRTYVHTLDLVLDCFRKNMATLRFGLPRTLPQSTAACCCLVSDKRFQGIARMLSDHDGLPQAGRHGLLRPYSIESIVQIQRALLAGHRAIDGR